MRHSHAIRASLCIALLALCTVPTFAADNTANATVGATVQAALQIESNRNLAFGKIAVSGGDVADSRVIVTPGGNRSVEGDEGGTALLAGGTVTSARFVLSGGSSNESFSIVLPVSVTINRDGGGASMTVDAFTSNPSGVSTLVAGTKTMTVGATLNVAPNQAAGFYSGPFNVTVYYN